MSQFEGSRKSFSVILEEADREAIQEAIREMSREAICEIDSRGQEDRVHR